MANLETLELTINGSATSAAEGIDNLVQKLSSLSDALTKPYSDLRDFNAELKKMRDYCKGFRLPDIAKATGAKGAAASARKAAAAAVTPEGNLPKPDYSNAKSEEQWWKEFRENLAADKKVRAERAEAIRQAKEQRDSAANAAKAASEIAYKTTRDAMDKRGDDAKAVMENANSLELLKLKYDAMKQALIDDARAGTLNAKQLAERSMQIQALGDKIASMQETSNETTSTLGKLKDGFKSMFSGIAGIFSRIKRIATTMLIRSAIRGLVSSMKEGVNSVYEWSKAVGGPFAEAMNSAKGAALTMKNSLGAALSPMITALIPLFKSLTNAIIECANWINQFIALLTGQSSWTHAIAQATDGTDDLANSASGAGAAAKEALAAFDELNVIQSGSGGGGGGGSGTETDYSGMFEQLTRFDEKIREITDFIKKNFELIKAMAIEIGVAILAWKLGNAFAETLPMLSKIFGFVATGAVIAITLQANWAFTNEALDTGNPGWLFAGALTTAVGSTAAWIIAKKLIGGKAGTYAATITLAFAAISDIVADVQHTNVSSLSAVSIGTRIKAALEAGAAAGVILHGTGVSGLPLLAKAGGLALITFGVATGLKAITEAKYTTWDTKAAISKSLLAAAPIGIGLLLAGGGVAVAAGATFLTFGAVLGLQAIISKDSITWGEVHLTSQQVEDVVNQQMFNVNVKATMDIIGEQLKLEEDERTRIETDLANTLGTFKVIKLGVATEQDYTQMQLDVENLIGSINQYIESVRRTGKLVLQYTPTLAGGTETESGEWFTNYDQGWGTIQKFVEEKGATIGKWLTDQESKEIKDAVPDVVAAAMEQLNAVTEAIAGAKASAEAFANFRISLGELDESSFTDVMKKFNEYKKDLEKTYSDLVNEQYQNQAALVEALKITLGPDFEDDPEYQEALVKLYEMGENMPQAIEDGVNAASKPGRDLVQEWIDKTFKKGSINVTWTDEYLASIFNVDGFVDGLEAIFTDAGMNMDAIDINELLEFGGWDLLNKDLQDRILANLVLDDSTITALKDNLKLDASQILSMANWNQFSTNEKWQFLKSLKKAFGSQEALKAAKDAGINIGDLVAAGMESSDPKIREEAQEWSKMIDTEVKDPEIKVKADKDETIRIGRNVYKWVQDEISGKKILVKVDGDEQKSKETGKKIYGWIDGETKKNHDVNAELSNTSKTNLKQETKDAVSNVSAEVSATVTLTNGSSFLDSIKQAIKKFFANFGIVIPWLADGGSVRSGQLFLAREAGPELVGSIGGRTTVANNDQIVEGIANGVAAANAEQNALLRRQNEILMGILQKEGNVRLDASSALGKTVQRSLKMYGAITGV